MLPRKRTVTPTADLLYHVVTCSFSEEGHVVAEFYKKVFRLRADLLEDVGGSPGEGGRACCSVRPLH